MGVLGLWDLLAPVGRIISIETLEGKRLAIDMSIWLTQFIKAMRNEDGTMIKNAHLIGTIKRLLKLLYNKVKPVFVFDGGVPILKIKTIEARTKLRSRNEQTVESTARRLLLTKLKQRELNKLNEKSNNNTTASNFASSFNPSPTKNNDQIQATSSSSHNDKEKIEPKVETDVDNDDIMWLDDKLEPLQRAKSLEEEELDEGDDDDVAYALPDNMDDLSPETLANLPLYMRKNVIIDARRRERMRSRAQFIPVADDPLLYSQTQVANFLKGSRLNQRIFEIQKIIEGDAQQDGKAIAAQSGKRYIMIQPNSASSSTSNRIQKLVDKELNAKASPVDDDDEEWMRDLDEHSNTVEERDSSFTPSTAISSFGPRVKKESAFMMDEAVDDGEWSHSAGKPATTAKSVHFEEKAITRTDHSRSTYIQAPSEIMAKMQTSKITSDVKASSSSAVARQSNASSSNRVVIRDFDDDNSDELRTAIALSLSEVAAPMSTSGTASMPLAHVTGNAVVRNTSVLVAEDDADDDNSDELRTAIALSLSEIAAPMSAAGTLSMPLSHITGNAVVGNASVPAVEDDADDDNSDELRAAIALSLSEAVAVASASDTVTTSFAPGTIDNEVVESSGTTGTILSSEGADISKRSDHSMLHDDIQWESDDEVAVIISPRTDIPETVRETPAELHVSSSRNSEHGRIDTANYIQPESNPVRVPSARSHNISQDTVTRAISQDTVTRAISQDTVTRAISQDTVTRAISQDTVTRAISTASSMTDWAAKEVQKVFKNHIPPLPSNSALVDLSAVTEEIPKKFISKEIFDLTDDIDSHADPVDHDIVATSNKAVGVPITASNVVLAATATATATATDSNKTALTDAVTDRNNVESDVVDSKTSQENTPLVSSDDIHHMLLEEEMQESALRSSQVNALRDAEKITEMMRIEVMQLLDAFSIPYIVAPFEAEAQCAVLEELGLVDGVITEDSDVFLFGAKTVYKNIFKDKQNVEVYLQSDIVSGLGLTREELVGLAYFLGSDYTEGVLGVGIVNAVEIIQCFPMKQEDGGPLEGLNKFKKWLDSYDFADTVKRLKSKRKRASTSKPRDNADSSDSDGEVDPLEVKLAQFTERHHHGRSKWKVDGTFPDKRVAEAYMKPPANRDVTPFEFNVPMLHRVRGYCHKVLGWSEADMNTQIDPIIRRFAENSRQSRIDSYFMRYEDDKRFAKIQSSRLAKALDIKISDKSSSPKKKQGDGGSKAKKTTKKQKKET